MTGNQKTHYLAARILTSLAASILLVSFLFVSPASADPTPRLQCGNIAPQCVEGELTYDVDPALNLFSLTDKLKKGDHVCVLTTPVNGWYKGCGDTDVKYGSGTVSIPPAPKPTPVRASLTPTVSCASFAEKFRGVTWPQGAIGKVRINEAANTHDKDGKPQGKVKPGEEYWFVAENEGAYKLLANNDLWVPKGAVFCSTKREPPSTSTPVPPSPTPVLTTYSRPPLVTNTIHPSVPAKKSTNLWPIIIIATAGIGIGYLGLRRPVLLYDAFRWLKAMPESIEKEKKRREIEATSRSIQNLIQEFQTIINTYTTLLENTKQGKDSKRIRFVISKMGSTLKSLQTTLHALEQYTKEAAAAQDRTRIEAKAEDVLQEAARAIANARAVVIELQGDRSR